MDKLKDIYNQYEQLAVKSEQAFEEMKQGYGNCVKCEIQCSDCCNAVFGLFPIESAYINYRFNELDEDARNEILVRTEEYEKNLQEMQEKLKECGDDARKANDIIARQRIRCPLLNDQHKCSLYAHRPVTCRVYGIPTIINGNIHACWKAGFEKGKAYPAFNLDGIYKELYELSKNLLETAGEADPEKAGLLAGMSKALKSAPDELLK